MNSRGFEKGEKQPELLWVMIATIADQDQFTYVVYVNNVYTDIQVTPPRVSDTITEELWIFKALVTRSECDC
jgi:hypothetical protein